ncbi:MAG: YfcC family protein [Treponema sp.]
MGKNKKKSSLTAFSILYIILFVLAAITWLIPEVKNATLGNIVMASYKGFNNAIDVCFFVLVLGGFLGIVTKTGALNAGIAHLVKKLKGNELILIPILMTLFSIGGTTYGMSEETVAFYGLLAATMVAAGFDSMVGAATILLGAGVGVLGSTVNPFATGIAIDSVNKSFEELGIASSVNNGVVITLGILLWLSSLIISCAFVMSYAKKVKRDKGSTILSLQEQEIMKAEFSEKAAGMEAEYTGKMKVTMTIFAFAFFVMVISVIPWDKFNVTLFEGWSSHLTGESLGNWWFGELGMWFLLIGIIIAVINTFTENEIVTAFMDGAKDIMSVVLVIAVARGASVLMGETGLDKYVLEHTSQALEGLPAFAFAPIAYIVYGLLSFVIPSTSGLATVSMPIMGPLAYNLGYNPAVMVMIFSAASGILNLFTPTSGVVMGGLAIARIEYSTWLKFVGKLLAVLLVVNVLILTIGMMVLS